MPGLEGFMGKGLEAFSNLGLVDKLLAVKDAASKGQALQGIEKTSLQEQEGPSTVNFSNKLAKSSKPTDKVRIEKAQKKGKGLGPIEQIKDAANKFQQKNPQEFKTEVLVNMNKNVREKFQKLKEDLRAKSKGMTNEDFREIILKTVQESYPDPTLTAEALNFLSETTVDDAELHKAVNDIREEFKQENSGRIRSGENITPIVRKNIDLGGKGGRDDYAEFTQSISPDTLVMFEQLLKKCTSLEELRHLIVFLFHCLGADLKSNRPSQEPAFLQDLCSQTRQLQAIWGVYRAFEKSMPLVEKQMQNEGIPMPPQLTYESMSKEFMKLCTERYPSESKVIDTSSRLLGISSTTTSKIIIITSFQRAVPEVSMDKIYKTIQRRDEFKNVVTETLDNLESQLQDAQETAERQMIANKTKDFKPVTPGIKF